MIMKQWRKLNGEKLKSPIEEEVELVILRELANNNRLKVCIGTDSQVKGETTEYATVIVFLREGKGGFMFISSEKNLQSVSLKERMIMEVSRSIDIAYKIAAILDQYNVGLEVHADINTDPDFKSNTALKDAMGYILGMGFIFKGEYVYTVKDINRNINGTVVALSFEFACIWPPISITRS